MTTLLLLLALAATDPHSQANPEQVTPTHLTLDLTLDFEAHRIQGTATLSLTYPGDRAAVRELHLDTHDLEIERVAAAGKPLPFTLDPAQPLLGQRLRITLPEPRPERVSITYRTSRQARALQWLEPVLTASGKAPFLMTQAQSIHARSFIPCADSPGVRVTYDALVHAPAGLSVVMAAEHGQHEPEAGRFRFRMTQPIPPYLIALAAGELAFRAVSPRAGVWADPTLVERAAAEFQDMEKMLLAAESLYGPYRWGRWDILVPPASFPFGGMENPRLTFATPSLVVGDRSLVSVLAHELAHSWSGNLVTNATWSDMWLNEGFTRYCESRIMELLYGAEAAEMHVLLGQRRLRAEVERLSASRPEDSVLGADFAGRDPDAAANSIAYEKGAALLRVLEKHFGRARFDGFLRRYFEQHAWQSMTTRRMVEILKADLFADEPAAWSRLKMDEWTRGRGIPDTIDVPASPRLARARAAAAAFAASATLGDVKRDWSMPEWVEFLSSLPRGIAADRLAALDAGFDLTHAKNPELLVVWLGHAARAGYQPAWPALEQFLTRQGRIKYVRPLYLALMENEPTRALGRRIFARARSGYHPLTVVAIEAVMAAPVVAAPRARELPGA